MIGSAVVSELAQTNTPLRVFVRDASKVAHLPNSIERVVGDFSNPASLHAAMSGIETAFLLSPQIEPAAFTASVAAARSAGVQRIVKLSTLEAGYGADGIARWHRSEEQQIEASGLAWTFVRPGNFASNALHWQHTMRHESKVYASTGDAKTSPIDPRDIASVIALALTSPAHAFQAHLITGPELLSVGEQVAVLSRVLQKPLSFVDVDPDQMGEQLLRYRTQPALASALVELWKAIRSDPKPVVTDTVQRLLGRPACTFEQWAQDHAATFR
jgi:(4-alkanoyl-5-oxo-2,5-dihydrofuran-3-yl)methyl phosphate reductase